MSRTKESIASRRVETLKRRRDFLDQRIAGYEGKDSSRDKAEASAIAWAIKVIEMDYPLAIELVEVKR